MVVATCHTEERGRTRARHRDGGTHKQLERMQTRQELYDTIGLHDFEELDANIIQTIVPQGMPQDA